MNTLAMTRLPLPALLRMRRVLVLVDVVESVRLMQADEADVIDRWRRFIDEVESEVLPRHGGRLVKSLGDGLLLDFEPVQAAIAAATDMQARITRYNTGCDAASELWLRMGVHVAEVVVDRLDVYGAGVNLAARVATLAGPGEIVVTSEVRAGLGDTHGVQLEDLGPCFLKHIDNAVRVFRVGAVGQRPVLGDLPQRMLELRPALAVIPFTPDAALLDPPALGDALADAIIGGLSGCAGLTVISRLSTASVRGERFELEEFHERLGAAYVITGSYRVRDGRVAVRAELGDTRARAVLWSTAVTLSIEDLFHAQDSLIPEIVACVGREVMASELRRARSLPVPSLEGYTLYLGGVGLLHRPSFSDFRQAAIVLQQLAERVPRCAAPHAMLAKWHLMQIVQGWSASPSQQGHLAQASARRALALEPDNALALSVDGLVAAHVEKDLERAADACEFAVAASPHEAHAWGVLGVIRSYQGQGAAAETAALRALQLSPLDPGRFVFDAFAAAAKLANGQCESAVGFARASIRANPTHLPAHRLLVLALAMAGRPADARIAAEALMQLDPLFSAGRFALAYPGRDSAHASRYVAAFRGAGIPD